jgi:hypothetical protein
LLYLGGGDRCLRQIGGEDEEPRRHRRFPLATHQQPPALVGVGVYVCVGVGVGAETALVKNNVCNRGASEPFTAGAEAAGGVTLACGTAWAADFEGHSGNCATTCPVFHTGTSTHAKPSRPAREVGAVVTRPAPGRTRKEAKSKAEGRKLGAGKACGGLPQLWSTVGDPLLMQLIERAVANNLDLR